MHIVEEAVKFLCEKSERPHDDFDVLAQRLGTYGDTLPDPRVVTPSEHERNVYKSLENHSIAQGMAIDVFNRLPWYKRVYLVLQGRIL